MKYPTLVTLTLLMWFGGRAQQRFGQAIGSPTVPIIVRGPLIGDTVKTSSDTFIVTRKANGEFTKRSINSLGLTGGGGGSYYPLGSNPAGYKTTFGTLDQVLGTGNTATGKTLNLVDGTLGVANSGVTKSATLGLGTTAGYLALRNGSAVNGLLQSAGLTGTDKTWILPNNSGTVALLSDIPTTASLGTGIIKNTTGSGAQSIAVPGTDYVVPGGTVAGFTGQLSGDVSGTQSAVTVTKINGVALSGLATGLLKVAGGTGTISTANAGDFPQLNQNTTGSAGTITGSINQAQVTGLGSSLVAKQDVSDTGYARGPTSGVTIGLLNKKSDSLAVTKLNIADTANLKPRFTAGANVTITGTYPSQVISATGGGGGAATLYSTTGSNTDGAITQAATSSLFDSKRNIGDTGYAKGVTAEATIGTVNKKADSLGNKINQSVLNSLAVSGTTTKTITGTKGDGSVVSATFTDANSGGTVTTSSVASANGFSGTITNPTTTPAISIGTTVSGIMKGGSGAVTAATPGIDYTTSSSTETMVNKNLSSSTNSFPLFSGANGGTGVNNGTKTITLGGNFTTAGAYPVTLTATASTSVTVPTTGTLATTTGTETFIGKSISGAANTITDLSASSFAAGDTINFRPSSKQDSAVDNSVTYALSLLGSPITNLGFGSPYFPYPGNTYGHDMYYAGEVTFTAIAIANPTTITGLKYMLYQSGAFTSTNYNGIGLYSISGGTLTLVASSANLPNIWKTAANTVITTPFTVPYVAQPGLYYAAAIYNGASETTTPRLTVNSGTFSPELNSTGFANGRFVNGKGSYTTAFPTTITTSAIIKTTAPDPTWVAAYK